MTLQNWFSAIGLAAAMTCASFWPAASQSFLTEGFNAWLDDAATEGEAMIVADIVEEERAQLGDEWRRLDALLESDFVLRDGAGGYIGVSARELADLSASLTLEIIANEGQGDLYGYYLRAAQAARGQGDLALSVVYAISMAASADRTTDDGFDINQLPSIVERQVFLFLEEVDARNRQTLSAEIDAIHAELDDLQRVINRAREMFQYSPPSPKGPPPAGFLNEPGYYILQVHGQGWAKRPGRAAVRATGYENLAVSVSDQYEAPTPHIWGWGLPTHADLLVFARERQEAAVVSSAASCERANQPGPAAARPSIWEDGPHYEIVAGPIEDWNEARAIQGSRSAPNNDPSGNSFWHLEYGFTYADLEGPCLAVGVSPPLP